MAPNRKADCNQHQDHVAIRAATIRSREGTSWIQDITWRSDVQREVQHGYAEGYQKENNTKFGRFVHPNRVDMDLAKAWIEECFSDHDCPRSHDATGRVSEGKLGNRSLR